MSINKPDPPREEMEAYARALATKLWPEGTLSSPFVQDLDVFGLMRDYPGRADSLFELGQELGLWEINTFGRGLGEGLNFRERRQLAEIQAFLSKRAAEELEDKEDRFYHLAILDLIDWALRDGVITKKVHDGAVAALNKWKFSHEQQRAASLEGEISIVDE